MDFPAIRFDREVVPFEKAIQPWIDQCEPALLPLVEKDYAIIRDQRFSEIDSAAYNPDLPLYIATAGAPCSKKSSVLDAELAKHNADPRYADCIMIDPDRYTMEYMNYTYRPLLSAGKKAELGVQKASKQAYDRARPGSNIISNLLFNEAFEHGFNIAHGTTMTSPFISGLLSTLGQAGYERKLLLCYAPDEVRVEAGRLRIEGEAHYQVDPADFANKGKLFPQRMADYFAHADSLVMFWSNEAAAPAIRAAEYAHGRREILDQSAFESFINQYDAHRAELAAEGINLPEWAEHEKAYVARFAPKGRAFNPQTPQTP